MYAWNRRNHNYEWNEIVFFQLTKEKKRSNLEFRMMERSLYALRLFIEVSNDNMNVDYENPEYWQRSA